MTAAERCATAAVGALLRDQPLSPGKISLAWRAAVGPAFHRVTTVALEPEGTLRVAAADRHWARELHRSRPVVAARLKQLLGDGVVTRIEIATSSRVTAEERQSHARVGHRQRRPPAHR